MLRSVDNYVEALLTLAPALHLWDPIAIVVAGLLVGNHGRRFAMSDRTREYLDTLWELIDAILNGVLFVLIGLEVIWLKFTGHAGLAAIPLILLARCVSVASQLA